MGVKEALIVKWLIQLSDSRELPMVWMDPIPSYSLATLFMTIEVVLESRSGEWFHIKTPSGAIIELPARGCSLMKGFKSACIILTNANTFHDSILELPRCKLIIGKHWPILPTTMASDFAFGVRSIFIKTGEAFKKLITNLRA